MLVYAQRARDVARDTLELDRQLTSTRRALNAVEADRDRWRDQRWREAHAEPWPA